MAFDFVFDFLELLYFCVIGIGVDSGIMGASRITWYEDVEDEDSGHNGDTCSSEHPSRDRILNDPGEAGDTSYSAGFRSVSDRL